VPAEGGTLTAAGAAGAPAFGVRRLAAALLVAAAPR